jgi:hypothetical protein
MFANNEIFLSSLLFLFSYLPWYKPFECLEQDFLLFFIIFLKFIFISVCVSFSLWLVLGLAIGAFIASHTSQSKSCFLFHSFVFHQFVFTHLTFLFQ